MYRLLQTTYHRSGDEKILKTLKISFDNLNDDEKNMFLDVSCFFCKDSYTWCIFEGEILCILNDYIIISK